MPGAAGALYKMHAQTTSCRRQEDSRGIVMKFTWGRGLIAAAAAAIVVSSWPPAWADVVVQIDKSSQRMTVSVDGSPRYNCPVSTGGGEYAKPSGRFHPHSMARNAFFP